MYVAGALLYAFLPLLILALPYSHRGPTCSTTAKALSMFDIESFLSSVDLELATTR